MKKTENALLSEISLGHRADVDFYYFCWMSFSYLGIIANQQELSGNCGLLAKINTITYINFILPFFKIIIISHVRRQQSALINHTTLDLQQLRHSAI